MLPLFNRVASMFTPDDLAVQFKELILFTQHLCEIIVLEIRQRANVENTGIAALAVHTFLRPPIQLASEATSSANRGWMLLNTISFILHSGMPKVLETMCKTTLPSTLIKLLYIFFDLPPPASKLSDDAEDSHQKLHNLLVSITNSLCESVIVTESLIQHDDLVWLFVGASAICENDSKCISLSTSKWREANFHVLLSVIGKSLSPPVIKYIHSKGCIGHYLKNIRAIVVAVPMEESKVIEASALLCDALELIRRSAVKTQDLLEDFRAADGYRIVVEFCSQRCIDVTSRQAREKVVGALAELCVAGNSTVYANPPTTPLSFYNFKLKQDWANSKATIRVVDAIVAMERCFRESESEYVCLAIGEQLLRLFAAERINYFIAERHAPLTLFVECMKEKSPAVQDAVLNLVEFVLRELHFIPSRELATVNALARYHVNCEKLEGIKTLWRYLSFFFRILPINICMKDAFRELLVLETFLNIVIINCSDAILSADYESIAAKTCPFHSDIITVTQMGMDLLVATTKGNAFNAQFVAENMDGRVLKLFLIGGDSETDGLDKDRERTNEFRAAALILIKNLLCAARNEQLLSSLLQLLFAEPSNLELCGVVLKLFISTLLESHKVRVMFRRSGGFICLMTLLLHLENSMGPSATVDEEYQSEQQSRQVRRHVALVFRVLIVAMRYEPSNARYFLVEVKPPMLVSILRGMGCFSNTSSINGSNSSSNIDVAAVEPSSADGNSINSSSPLPSILGAESAMWTAYVEAEDEQRRKCLAACHVAFQSATTTMDDYIEKDNTDGPLDDVIAPPKLVADTFLLLRLLMDLALDNYEKASNTIMFARVEEWLAGSETVETIPVLSFSARTVLVHPSAVICLLQLLPFVASSKLSNAVPSSFSLHHHLWSASAQFYVALVLKALLRSERNQQTMCQHAMAKELLATGATVFRAERHPLLTSFYYLFERLACHAMHPGELRRFLRLDQPLCCLNLDDDDNNHEKKMTKSGGPVPIHRDLHALFTGYMPMLSKEKLNAERVKALVSMLTPRSHALIHPPAFVEFDMAIEGFACLFAPSIANVLPLAGSSALIGGSSESGTAEKLFPPMNGFTYMIWFYVDEFGHAMSVQSSLNDSTYNSPGGSGATGSATHHSTISLLNIVRQYESGDSGGAVLDNHLSCFSMQLNVAERHLLVSTAEHAVADELCRNFSRPPETFIRLALPDTIFHARQWIHLAVVMQRSLLRPSHVDVYMNGKQLGGASLRIAYVAANAGASVSCGAASSVDYSGTAAQPVHAFIGTPPLLRRAGDMLRWRMASAYLVDEPLGADAIRRAMQLQPHYIGNLQTPVNGGTIISSEDRLILALNAAANAEFTSQVMRSITRLSDCEMVGSLLGISTNDSSTPLRILWNTGTVATAATSCTLDSSSIVADSGGTGATSPAPVGAILIGYLGMRTFAPCPVSALLDSIGGVAPLLGLIAMCSDSDGLYASLKALASAAHTNAAIGVALTGQRGYQTLAMLLEEKAHLLNAHSLHLVLSLTGTALSAAEVSAKESVAITNLQTFNDLLCDLDVWARVHQDVKRLLFDHFYELVIDDQHSDNLAKVRASSLLDRVLVFLFESDEDLFGVRHDVLFRLVGAIVQPPCEAALLLRLGQTIAATMAPDGARGMETEFPFHIAELERYLLMGVDSTCVKGNAEEDDERRKRMYSVYVRNRLLNILSTMIAHSSGPMNSKICTTLIDALGFGWLLALCAPRIHAGTLHLALRILVQIVTKYPTLMERFRDGIGAGGWLSDADSIVRNRAAVLLGFSVAARTGAVGSAVDVNPPELTACSGFTALEHVAYVHAHHPFVHLAVLALLFRQPTVNLQPLDTFSIDAVWSHVFVLPQNSSVATAIENVQFCAEALIPLLALVRACLHRQLVETQENHWSHNYPLMIGQLLTFLYQNSSTFFNICHTETFMVRLFSTLLAAPAASLTTAKSNNNNSQKSEAINTQMPCIVGNRAARLLKEMLTNVLLNDLCLSHEQRVEWPFDALVEFLESGAAVTVNSFSASFLQANMWEGSDDNRGNFNSVGSTVSATALYTDIVNACLERFMTSEMFGPTCAGPPLQHNTNAITNAASESTALNVVHFLGKVIDSVWNCLYRSTTINILKCFLKLLADAHATHKAAAQLSCTDAHLNSLFRIVLYLLSRPIDNIDTQMSVLDTLAEIVRNQHLLLARSANTPLHYGALVHLVFMLSERPDLSNAPTTTNCSVDKSHLERGTAQVAMCAQNVWGMLWQHKKVLLDELFKRDVDLDLYTARAACGDAANDYWLQFVDAQTDCGGVNSSSASSRVNAPSGSGSGGASNAVGHLLQSRLSRVARTGFQRLTSRHSLPLSGGGSIGGIGSGASAFHFERPKIEADTFHMWMRVHVSLVRELVRARCQRQHEWHAHVQKWSMKEWQENVEAELTRERGLWGPERASRLDKFELDTTEGPLRVRKKLVPDADFYRRYPFRPYLALPEAKSLRAKLAVSKDSREYYQRMRERRFNTMDERILEDVMPQSPASIESSKEYEASLSGSFDLASSELNLSLIKRMMQKNLAVSESAKKQEKMKTALSEKDPDGEEGANAAPKNDDSQEVLEENEEEEEDVLELIEGKSMEDSTALEDIQLKSSDVANQNERLIDTPKVQRLRSAYISGSSSGGVSGTTSPSSTTTANTVEQKRLPPPNKQSAKVGGNSGPDNQTLLRLLEHGEQLHSMFRCARVQGLDTFEGLLLFGRSYFYVVDGFTLLKTREIRDLDFLPEQFHDPIVPYMAMGSAGRPTALKSARRCSKFAYDSIREVHKRRFLLQPIALEVFSADGRNYLLAFPRRIRDRVFQKFVSTTKSVTGVNVGVSGDTTLMAATTTVIGGISSAATHRNRLLLPAVAAVNAAADGRQLLNQLIGSGSGQLSGSGGALMSAGCAQPSALVTQRWQRGEMSNFHYLMYLNTLAGRSYNDLSQYPVFPWILADYESERLDLTSPHTFRDLARPMGAQTPDRLSKFLRRFREWDDPTGDTPPYMYGTHYSSAMIVLSYLVRLEPFTQQFLKLQGGHFDLADRMFHSVRDAWSSASRNNMADVRELIPEFFYLPEMFLNSNRFDLGTKQNGVVLHHVELPRWANGDPHEFVRIHRQALESDYVSEHLHEWIDLIFGVKQSGDAARDAFNVFHHLFYERNVNVDTIDDPLTRNATLAFINNFGQIPSQLFRRAHPQRRVLAAVAKVSTTDAAVALMTLGVTTPKLFYHCVESLRVSAKPVKELRAAIGDIVINERNQVIVLEQNRIFIPPASYMAWGFADRSVRVGAIGTEKSESVLETSDVYEITCMATTDGGRTVFAGLTTGSVLVWTLAVSGSATIAAAANLSMSSGSGGASATPTAHSLTNGLLHRKRRALDAHTDVVTALAASAAHSCMVSASRDRSVVIWHLTRFTFLRQLGGAAVHPSAVTAVAINEATGDIATASGAFLYLWTINGVLLSAVDTSIHDLVSPLKTGSGCPSAASLILCICFSTLYEWDANNVLVCGTSDGFVKIYSCQFVDETAGAQRGPKLTALYDVDSNTNCKLRSRHSKSPRPGGSECTDSVSGDVGATKQQVREHILRRQQRIQIHHQHRMAMMSGGGSGGGQRSSSSSSSFSSSPVVGPLVSPAGGGVEPLVKAEQSLSDKNDQYQTTSCNEEKQQETCESSTCAIENAKSVRHEEGASTHGDNMTVESSKEQQSYRYQDDQKIKVAAEQLSAEDLLALNVMPPTQSALPRHRLLLRRVLAEHTAFRHAPHPAPVTSLRPTRDHKSLLVGDGVGRVWLWTMLNNND